MANIRRTTAWGLLLAVVLAAVLLAGCGKDDAEPPRTVSQEEYSIQGRLAAVLHPGDRAASVTIDEVSGGTGLKVGETVQVVVPGRIKMSFPSEVPTGTPVAVKGPLVTESDGAVSVRAKGPGGLSLEGTTPTPTP